MQMHTASSRLCQGLPIAVHFNFLQTAMPLEADRDNSQDFQQSCGKESLPTHELYDGFMTGFA